MELKTSTQALRLLSKPSLYAEYIKETLSREIVEAEGGFITYEISGDTCYLFDVFVEKDRRSKGTFLVLCREALNRARAAGCKKFVGVVSMLIANKERNLMVYMGLGMKILSCNSEKIFLERDI